MIFAAKERRKTPEPIYLGLCSDTLHFTQISFVDAVLMRFI